MTLEHRQECGAADSRGFDIEHHGVEWGPVSGVLGCGECGLGAISGDHVMAFDLQVQRNVFANVGVVVDKKHAGHDIRSFRS